MASEQVLVTISGSNILPSEIGNNEIYIIKSTGAMFVDSNHERFQIKDPTKTTKKEVEDLIKISEENINKNINDKIIVSMVGKKITNGGEIFNDYTNNKATALFSSAKGFTTQAKAKYSSSEGNTVTVEGEEGHGEGSFNILYSKSGHIEGSYNIGGNLDSVHNEGKYTITNSLAGHTEGYGTLAGKPEGSIVNINGETVQIVTKIYSDTTSKGLFDHAEGHGTNASGHAAHSQNFLTIASGNYSDASGWHTIARYTAQSVMGRFNFNKSNTLLEVGFGSSDIDRKNALEVYDDGHVEIFKQGQSDNSLVTLKYIKSLSLNNIQQKWLDLKLENEEYFGGPVAFGLHLKNSNVSEYIFSSINISQQKAHMNSRGEVSLCAYQNKEDLNNSNKGTIFTLYDTYAKFSKIGTRQEDIIVCGIKTPSGKVLNEAVNVEYCNSFIKNTGGTINGALYVTNPTVEDDSVVTRKQVLDLLSDGNINFMIDNQLLPNSSNAVQNKVIYNALSKKASTDIVTDTSSGLMYYEDKIKLDSLNKDKLTNLQNKYDVSKNSLLINTDTNNNYSAVNITYLEEYCKNKPNTMYGTLPVEEATIPDDIDFYIQIEE